MSDVLARNVPKLEKLARDYGLDFYPVDFELTPSSFMLEISVYGLPVRMPHWSFGVRYIHQLVRQHMGNSRIFEVMFPGDPCHAYLQETNTDPENTLVVAHVLGHADFSKNNHLFERYHKMSGGNIVEMAAAHAHGIEDAMRKHGVEKVEPVLDAALALESHVDVGQELHRGQYPAMRAACQAPCCAGGARSMSGFQKRFGDLPGQEIRAEKHAERAPIPPHPEQDLLWFISQYGEELEDWERDIFLAVRAESFYFYPVFACQIMNEGWASYWHARLLREADFLPQDQYLSAIKCHSDVVSPYASGEQQTSLQINPYHLGFSMWEHIVETQGLEAARRILREEDDFSFIRNHLDRDMADRLGLFVWEAKSDGEIKVVNRDINLLRENILAPRFNYGSPRIAVSEMKADGTLVLRHDHKTDGRGLDVGRAEQVLKYVHRLWRRPVRMVTADADGRDEIISVDN
jgi:stage V sporulation protein R